MGDEEKALKIRVDVESEEGIRNLQKTQEALKGAGKATEGAGQDVDLFNTKSREMMRLIDQADRLVPGLGEVMRAAFRPETLGIGIAVAAVGGLIEMFQSLTAAAKAAAEAAGKAMEEAMARASDATLAADKILVDYQLHLEEVAKKANDITKAEEAHLELLKQTTEEQKKILEAMEKVALANAAGDKERQAAIRADFEGRKAGADATGEQHRIADMQTYLEDAQQKAAGLQAEADQRMQEQADEARQQTNNKGFFENQLKGDQAELAGLQGSLGSSFAGNPRVIELQSQIGQATELLREMQANEAAAAQKAKDAQKAYDDNEAAIDKWTAEINKAHDDLDQKNRTNATIGGIEKFGPKGAVEGTMSGALTAAIDAQHGKLTSHDREALAAFNQLMELVGLNGDAVMSALSKSTNKQVTMAQELALIHHKMDALGHNTSQRADGVGI